MQLCKQPFGNAIHRIFFGVAWSFTDQVVDVLVVMTQQVRVVLQYLPALSSKTFNVPSLNEAIQALLFLCASRRTTGSVRKMTALCSRCSPLFVVSRLVVCVSCARSFIMNGSCAGWAVEAPSWWRRPRQVRRNLKMSHLLGRSRQVVV